MPSGATPTGSPTRRRRDGLRRYRVAGDRYAEVSAAPEGIQLLVGTVNLSIDTRVITRNGCDNRCA